MWNQTLLPRRCLFAGSLVAAMLLVLSPAAMNPRQRGARGARAEAFNLAPGRLLAPVVEAAQQNAPDSQYEVPWNGTLWQTMPNFTWAACGVTDHTRTVLNIAQGQWSYAASNQGVPIQFTELPCTGGASQAEIRIFEASSTDLSVGGTPDVDVFGLTLAFDANNQRCVIDVPPPCVAGSPKVYLFTDSWEQSGLTYAQAAKTVAHELGHVIGLGHAHFCNFESVMAQDCEPVLPGLGADDVQSIDALVDYVRAYFNESPLNAQPIVASPANPAPPATTVTYHAGYNLVGGPRGTVFGSASGPLYSMLPGDSAYRSIPVTQAAYDGYGYWAYFTRDATVQLTGSGSPFYSAVVAPHKWFLLGNDSSSGPMRVLGAEAVYEYDTPNAQYRMSTTLEPGQGAWVLPDKNGLIAVASTSLTRDQVRCYLNLGSPASC